MRPLWLKVAFSKHLRCSVLTFASMSLVLGGHEGWLLEFDVLNVDKGQVVALFHCACKCNLLTFVHLNAI